MPKPKAKVESNSPLKSQNIQNDKATCKRGKN